MTALTSHTRHPAFGAAIFGIFVAAGALYIIWAKLVGMTNVENAFIFTTGVPLLLMLLYAALLWMARYFRLRDDQSGDNLYYLGFLYTLTSLAVALKQFNIDDGAASIVSSFGIAIATTIMGIALRVLFNQMRQDPIEVESVARLELADAARKVRQELDSASFEFASFRRSLVQMQEETLREQREHSERLVKTLFENLADLPDHTAKPLAAATQQSRDLIEELAKAVTERISTAGQTLSEQEKSLASSTKDVSISLQDFHNRVKALQTPDQIIEVKLQPFIQGFTKAMNAHSKATDAQMAELQSIISKFSESIEALARQMSADEQKRAAELQIARETSEKAQQTAAETHRLLQELARTSNAPPAASGTDTGEVQTAERIEPRGWSIFPRIRQ
jgi:hypothetical protein